MRKILGGVKSDKALESIIDLFMRTKTNAEFIDTIKGESYLSIAIDKYLWYNNNVY